MHQRSATLHTVTSELRANEHGFNSCRHPCESLVALGRASGQKCTHASEKCHFTHCHVRAKVTINFRGESRTTGKKSKSDIYNHPLTVGNDFREHNFVTPWIQYISNTFHLTLTAVTFTVDFCNFTHPVQCLTNGPCIFSMKAKKISNPGQS